MLVWLASLLALRQLLMLNQLRKFREGILRLGRGELAAGVAIKKRGELGRLAADFNQVSRKLKELRERQLSCLAHLRQENLFHSHLSQMILNLQCCFAKEDLGPIIATFLGRIFPEDSGSFLLKSAQHKAETIAVWGSIPVVKTVFPHKCLALWEWQVHCGPACKGRFGCRFDQEHPKVHICVPVGTQTEAFGLLQVLTEDEEQRVAAKTVWASLVAEHLGLICANVKMGDDLRNLSLRDPLTGLFNRRFMEEALSLEIAKAARHGKTLGVIMLDLDHFKRFNDNHGHLAGDNLLREIGLLLHRHCRSSDIACRYGGEEFTLIMAGADKQVLVKRIEELRAKARKLRVWHLYQWLSGTTFSAGMAIYPDHGATAEVLLKSADHALYRAKETGRNRICVAGDEQSQDESAGVPWNQQVWADAALQNPGSQAGYREKITPGGGV